jgi:rhodanese-related sulfurtransferase
VALAVCLIAYGLKSQTHDPVLQSPSSGGPPTAPAAQILKPADIKKYIDYPKSQIVIVDLQERDQFAIGHIPSSLNIPSDEIEIRADDELDKTNQIILVGCACDGTNSDSLLRRSSLLKHGFKDMAILDGGVKAWKNAKLPIVTGSQSEVPAIGKSNQ